MGDPGWGWVIRKMKPSLEAWNFEPQPPSSWKGRGLEVELTNHAYLQDEAAIKIPKVGGSERLQVGEHIHMFGKWCIPNSMETEILVPWILPDFALYSSSFRCSSVSFII